MQTDNNCEVTLTNYISDIKRGCVDESFSVVKAAKVVRMCVLSQAAVVCCWSATSV